MAAKSARIESLTDQQQARLAEWRDKWLRIGLSTEPADRKAAEAAVALAYRAANLEPPAVKIWLRSPFEGAVAAAMLASGKMPRSVRAQVGAQVWAQVWAQVGDQVRDQVRDQVGAQVWAQVWAQVGDQVWAQVWAQVGDQVRDQVWAQVGDQVGDQVRDQVWAQVRAQVRAQVGAQVGDQVRDQVWAQVWDQVGAQVGDQVRDQVNRAGYGQHDAGWLGWADYFGTVVGLACVERLAGLIALAQSGSWWWPFQGAVILTDRPSLLARDGGNRLHSVTGPALEYRDGWKIYAVHGVRVPAEWIEKREELAPETALTWKNIEQRRAAAEIIGWDRVLASVQSRVVHADPDPQIGTLLRVDLPDAPGSQFLQVQCGTGRRFCLPVPAEMKTARQANAWTYGLDEAQYQPEVRT